MPPLPVIIDKPLSLSSTLKDEAIDLIMTGGQVKFEDARVGVHRAALLAVYQIDNQIIATACFKNPRKTYVESVFRAAKVPELIGSFKQELGYIVTRKGFEGQHICQQLLKELFPQIKSYSMFATTRKSAMVHILERLGFEKCGEVYKQDLQLLVFPHNEL